MIEMSLSKKLYNCIPDEKKVIKMYLCNSNFSTVSFYNIEFFEPHENPSVHWTVIIVLETIEQV